MDTPLNAAATVPPFPYEGPAELRQPVVDALTRVVDPKVALSIVDVGLPWFYVPLALPHASLVLRLAFGFASPALRGAGAALNAVALALFAAMVVGSAVAWRARGDASLPKETT